MTWLEGLDNVTSLGLDGTKPAEIKITVETIKNTTDRELDFFVNNAGGNYFMPVMGREVDAIRHLFEINYLGPLSISQAFVRLLIKVC
jgi:1-acylglycerone phosphate reductase